VREFAGVLRRNVGIHRSYFARLHQPIKAALIPWHEKLDEAKTHSLQRLYVLVSAVFDHNSS
jgi:hypothetical protein